MLESTHERTFEGVSVERDNTSQTLQKLVAIETPELSFGLSKYDLNALLELIILKTAHLNYSTFNKNPYPRAEILAHFTLIDTIAKSDTAKAAQIRHRVSDLIEKELLATTDGYLQMFRGGISAFYELFDSFGNVPVPRSKLGEHRVRILELQRLGDFHYLDGLTGRRMKVQVRNFNILYRHILVGTDCAHQIILWATTDAVVSLKSSNKTSLTSRVPSWKKVTIKSEEVRLYQEQRWYPEVHRKVSNSKTLVDEAEKNRKDVRLFFLADTIQNHFNIRGTLLSDIYSYYTMRRFSDQMRSTLVKSNSSSFSLANNQSQRCTMLAQSFIKIGEGVVDLCWIIEDVKSFLRFFTRFLVLYYDISDQEQRQQLPTLILNSIFNYDTFYNNLRSGMTKQLITISKQYKDNLKHFQSLRFEAFEIKDLDYQKSIDRLKEVANYRSPLEKLDQLIQSIKLLNVHNYDADTLINTLVYVITKADIQSFVFDLKIIEHFSERLNSNGQEAYVIISYMAALFHIIQFSTQHE